MSTIEKSAWAVAAILMLCACDGPTVTADAGEQDAGSQDAGEHDAGAQDAGMSGCDCAADQACVRGVCIATCGGDVTGFDAALAEGLVPVANFCRPAAAWTVRDAGGSLEVWDLAATTEGTVTTFTLSRWALDPSMQTPEPTAVATATYDTGDESIAAFPSGFVAIDPSGEHALFGYTTTADGYPGDVVLVTTADGTTSDIAAPGNFDAAWLDAHRVLVNARGLDDVSSGAGLYAGDITAGALDAVYAVTGLGANSGSVVAGGTYLVAGSADDSFAPHDYVMPLAAVDAAIASGTPLDVTADASLLTASEGAPPSTFSQLADRIVPTPFGGPLASYTLDERSGALSDARTIATGSTFTDVAAAGSGRMLLAHQDATTFTTVSLLLVQE